MPAASQDSQATDANKPLLDLFKLNQEFRSNMYRINLPIPALEEEGTTSKKPKLAKDRAHTIDASIIKRMKTHKRMDMNELLTEVIQALNMFQPDPKLIKQRIERLIQDEFLARDENLKNILVYLP